MNNFFKSIVIASSVLIVSAVTGYTVLAWTEPGLSAPNGNVAAPINTGSTAQGKLGNLGVGTASPGTTLDVNGVIRGSSDIYTTSGGLGSTINSNEGGLLTLTNNNKTGTAANHWTLYNMTGSYGNSFQIWDYPANALPRCCISRFILKDDGTTVLSPSGGNVGIGMASPQASLDINGYLHASGNTTPVITSQGAYLSWNGLTGGTGETDIINNQGGGAGGFAFMNAPASGSPKTTLMFINGSGSVGIGKTNPLYALDIKSGSQASQVHLSPSSDDGVYITSVGQSNGIFSAGASYSGNISTWTAKYTSAWMLGGDGGWAALFANSGLTPGQQFTASPRLSVWPNGNVGLGGSDAVNSPIMIVTGAGAVGIGTTAPTAGLKLDVRGALGVFGAIGTTAGLTVTQDAYVGGNLTVAGQAYKPWGGTWASSSDSRLKKNITPMTGALNKITQLQGVNFEWVNPQEHGNAVGPQGGFIAQDVEKIFPDWVQKTDPSGADKKLIPANNKALSISLPFEYDALMVEAIKEQQQQMAQMKNDIDNLKSEIKDLKAQIK